MIVLSHPTVNQFNRTLAQALEQAGLLGTFHTTLAFGRRRLDLPSRRVSQHLWPEIARLLAGRFGLSRWTHGDRSWFAIDAVYRALDRSVARSVSRSQRAVYAYEDGALATFRAARDLGLPRFYELPIAYFETVQLLLAEEAERLPEWAPTLGAPEDSAEKLARKAEELSLATQVICPSAFVQRTLPPGTPSVVAEFGSPQPRATSPSAPTTGPLRVLFVGSMTQRKGLADVFAAMSMVNSKHIELIVMGVPVVEMDFYRKVYPHFRHEQPRPHGAVLDLMESCHVLVLPSIVEGRALVQQEAMSCGLPLIATVNAGGEDLIVEGETGWLLPIRDPEAIATHISWLADHRSALKELGEAARRKAVESTWERYCEKIINSIRAELGSP